jgi:hypothetical protein
LKTKKVSGVAKSAYGKPLHILDTESKVKLPKGSTLKFAGEYNEYESADELKERNIWPNDDQIVKWVNRDARNNARNKAQTIAFDAAGIIKPTIENDEMLRLRDMVKILVASGQTEDAAKVAAAAMLNIDLDSIDETED